MAVNKKHKNEAIHKEKVYSINEHAEEVSTMWHRMQGNKDMHQGCFDDNRDQGGDTDEAIVHWWKVAVIELEDISRCCNEEKSTVMMDPKLWSNKEGTMHGNPWHHMRIVIQSNSTESNNDNRISWSQGENGLVRQIVVYVKNVLA